MKKVKTKSGLTGYQCKLRDNYENLDQWETYADMYGLHLKLGYHDAKVAWDENPIIQGSTNPNDFCKVVGGKRYFFDVQTGFGGPDDE